MPLFYQQDMHDIGRLGIWRITEDEYFFLDRVPLQRDITHPHKRRQHLAGRYLLQLLYPDFPYELIRIADTRRPYLANEAYHFSISHCGNFAAAFVSPFVRVGVDVEEASPRVIRVLHKFLNQQERSWYEQEKPRFDRDHPQQGPYGLANLLWSAKETVYKWYGEGGIDFSEVIRTEGFASADAMNVRFAKGEGQSLQLGFRLWDDLCLSWVQGDYTG